MLKCLPYKDILFEQLCF